MKYYKISDYNLNDLVDAGERLGKVLQNHRNNCRCDFCTSEDYVRILYTQSMIIDVVDTINTINLKKTEVLKN